MTTSRFNLVLPFLLAIAACQSTGPYGHSRVYSPLDAEEEAAESAREFDPVMALRAPEDWKDARVSLFGVVKNRQRTPQGETLLTVSLRALAQRNICDARSDSSCRVTVGEREHGIVQVVTKLSGDQEIGKLSVIPGSLIRAIGQLRPVVGSKRGPVLSASYLRHWPRAEYVTMSDSIHMRR